MAWRLNTALTNWREAVNSRYPNRDKTSDGTIGDEAHQQTPSDHNPDADGTVDAWDMDVNLRSGNDSAAIEQLKRVFQAHPAARYWIHNRQIAHRSTGWVRKPYTGDNPHDKHVHWNSNEATEDSTAPWIIPGGNENMAEFTEAHADAVLYTDGRMEAQANGRDTVRSGLKGAGGPMWMVTEMKAQSAALAAIAAALPGIDDETLQRLDALRTSTQAIAPEVVSLLAARPAEDAAELILAAVGQERARALAEAIIAASV